MTLKIILTY